MAQKLDVSALDGETGVLALLERVAGIIDNVQACQTRMEERQLELEASVKGIQADVAKLTKDHTTTNSVVEKLLEKTRKVSCHIKDVRVRVEKQNERVKKVEETQGELLMKNKFRVVIYQGDNEVKAAAAPKAEAKDEAVEPPPIDSEDEYVVVKEGESSAARMKKGGLKRIESLKATFSRETMSKTKENLGTKVNKLGERIVTAERREKIRQSGERIKASGERFKETIKNVPAKLNLKKERTVAEGQEGAEGSTEGAAPVAPAKGRKANDVAYTDVALENEEGAEGKGEESEVPMYDMKQLS
ncbi:hypothetical protein ACEWY4_018756 [Coilia grayii]|uniref:Muscle-related coiled-coil protein n=1 Tax=Coilia grayii TaxID=363190 RepID=A0ABD1JE38_9TELE